MEIFILIGTWNITLRFPHPGLLLREFRSSMDRRRSRRLP
jgi:hypothetical protein